MVCYISIVSVSSWGSEWWTLQPRRWLVVPGHPPLLIGYWKGKAHNLRLNSGKSFIWVLPCRSYNHAKHTYAPPLPSVPRGSRGGPLPDAAEGALFPLRDAPGPDPPSSHTHHRGNTTFTGTCHVLLGYGKIIIPIILVNNEIRIIQTIIFDDHDAFFSISLQKNT